MTDEPTKKTDTGGTEPNPAVAADGEPISDYDKALALVERREKATKAENEVLDRKEKLAANQMNNVGTTGTGSHVEPVKPEDIDSKEYAENVLANKLNDIKKE